MARSGEPYWWKNQAPITFLVYFIFFAFVAFLLLLVPGLIAFDGDGRRFALFLSKFCAAYIAVLSLVPLTSPLVRAGLTIHRGMTLAQTRMALSQAGGQWQEVYDLQPQPAEYKTVLFCQSQSCLEVTLHPDRVIKVDLNKGF